MQDSDSFSRSQFIDAACAQRLPENASDDERSEFARVDVELRRMARLLDVSPSNWYLARDWPNRECLCGRLAVLIASNPAAAREKLDAQQQRLAVQLLQAAQARRQQEEAKEDGDGDDDKEDKEEQPREPVVDESKDELHVERRAGRVCLHKQDYSKLRDAALLLGAPVVAGIMGGLAAGLLGGAAVWFARKGLQWGRPLLRNLSGKVDSVIRGNAAQRRIVGMQTALQQYTLTPLGGVDTADLRDRFARYIAMDAQVISDYISSVGSVDGARNLNEFLLQEVRRRVRQSGGRRRSPLAKGAINRAVGRVLAEFTFGGATLKALRDEQLPVAFVPVQGVAHIDAGSMQTQHNSLRQLFAENYFVPSDTMRTLDDLPENIWEFWLYAMADALHPNNPNNVVDEILFTMYFFAGRYVKHYGVLERFECKSTAGRLAAIRRAATLATERGGLSMDVLFDCLFENYEQRFSQMLSWTEWARQKFGLQQFGFLPSLRA